MKQILINDFQLSKAQCEVKYLTLYYFAKRKRFPLRHMGTIFINVTSLFKTPRTLHGTATSSALLTICSYFER